MDNPDNLDEQFNQATERGRERVANAPRAVGISYDSQTKRILIDLQNGVSFIVPTALVQILANASDEQISDVEIAVQGLYLRWKSLDEDLFLPNLMQGVFGTQKWMDGLKQHLSAAGSKGGAAKTEAKRKASAENGKKGGRPRQAA